MPCTLTQLAILFGRRPSPGAKAQGNLSSVLDKLALTTRSLCPFWTGSPNGGGPSNQLERGMPTDGPYDVRAICNIMLDVAQDANILVSNLALQKLLYFAHARHLIETKRPLVTGYFEAWQYGPVHPAAYKAFKAANDAPITFRAVARNPLTGQETQLEAPRSATVTHVVRSVMQSYGPLTPGRLVEISHAKGAPWQFVVDQAHTRMAFGLRISDNVIIERFKFHKISVGTVPMVGEPVEDTPFI